MPELVNTQSVRRLFLHFFDVHFLEVKEAQRIKEIAYNEARLATRFAIL